MSSYSFTVILGGIWLSHCSGRIFQIFLPLRRTKSAIVCLIEKPMLYFDSAVSVKKTTGITMVICVSISVRMKKKLSK